MSEPRKRLTYSNVVSTLCLALVVGGGTAYAAGLAPNSVGSAQIKNGEVRTPDIKANAVKGSKVKKDTLTGADINESSLSIAAFGNASNVNIDNFTSSTPSDILTVNFTAPSAGVVMLVASLNAEDDVTLGGDGRLTYRLAVDGVSPNTSFRELDYDNGDSGAGDSSAVTATIPVTAGAHVASLQGDEIGAGSFIFSREISVLFVPNGEGFTPLGKPHGKSNN